MTRVRVVGAGLSGLASAWYLSRLGADVEVLEASARPGGLIGTRVETHGLVETAANALVCTSDVRELFEDLGLELLAPQPESRRRYIVRDGVPRRWPLSPLETAGTAARVGIRWATRTIAPRAGESVAAWGRRTLGSAATQHVLEPALQGIYAAPASLLSAEAIGLGRRRRRPGLAAPRAGMGALIGALHAALTRRGVRFTFGTAVEQIDRDAPTLICTNAPAAARLVASAGLEPLAESLRSVKTLPLVTATAFFEPAAADLRGFGVLFPPGAARARGVLFNSDTFMGRSDLRSETWIFGGADVLRADDTEVARAIQDDRRLIGGAGAPVSVHVTRVPAALPLYDEAILAVRQACDALPPWLGICGNYAGQIGVAGLLARARSEAGRLLSR